MGEFSYRPLIEDMTWSYSRVKSFDACPYQWFCKYIHGDREEPMFYSSYGSFVHRLIEQYYRGLLSKEELPLAFLLGFSENVLGQRPSRDTVVKYIRAGEEYFRNFKPFPFRMLSVEEELHFDLGGFPFVAFLDFCGERDGKLAIVDNKSRDLRPRSGRKGAQTGKDRELDEMLEQLYVYAHGVRQIYGEFPDRLCFNCFRTGRFLEEPFDRAAYERTLDRVRRKIEEIASEEEFRPNIEYFRCKYLCGLHKDCCYCQGG